MEDTFTRRRALAAAGAGIVAAAGCTTTAGTDDLCGAPDASSTPATTVGGDGGGALPGLASEAAWTHTHADAASTGFVPGDGPLSGVTHRWSFAVPSEYGTAVVPVVAEGALYVAATEVGTLRAFDGDGGGERWVVDDHDRLGEPAVRDGVVYVGSDRGLLAYDAGIGTRRWSFEPSTGAEVGRVVATDAGILVQTGERVVAVDDAGDERWQARASRLGAVADGVAYVDDGETVALDVDTGERRWVGQPSNTYGDVAVRNGTVYAASGHTLYALDAADGSLRWSYRGEEEFFDQPTVTPDRVYVPTSPVEGRDGGNLYALDPETGEPAWCSYLGFVGVVTPAATDAGVFVATDEGLVQARDHDGAVRWTFRAGSAWFDRVAAAGDALFAGTTDGDPFGFVET